MTLKYHCQLQIMSCGDGGCGDETMARHALMGHKRNQCQTCLTMNDLPTKFESNGRMFSCGMSLGLCL
jgi:hypothetical protein